jgi:hypothetical protein
MSFFCKKQIVGVSSTVACQEADWIRASEEVIEVRFCTPVKHVCKKQI